jgi:hypothetical protein
MIRSCPEPGPTSRHNTPPCIFLRSLSAVIVVFFLLLLISCEEGDTGIGSRILPGSDYVSISSIDTLSAFTYTRYLSGVRSDNATYAFVGSVYDPYFGRTTAEFVSQIRLAAPWPGESFAVDSVRLVLSFQTVKGNVDTEHVLKISEISELIYADSAYYSDKPVLLSGYDLPDLTLPQLRADTVNNVTIALPVGFGEYLLRDTSKLFHSNSVPDFRSWFRGLYFRMAEPTDPLLLTLRMASDATSGFYKNYIVVYYHNDDNEQKSYYFIFDAVSPNARYNRFSHNFEAAEPDKRIAHINDGIRDTVSFVQSLNGAYASLHLPGLDVLREDPAFTNVAINKALLKVPVYFDDVLYKATTVSKQLLLSYKTTNGSQFIVPDYYIGTDYYGGTLDSVNRIYTFNIAAYVQRYLKDKSGEIVPGLNIQQPAFEMKNTILKTRSKVSPVELEIIFTRY